MLTLRTSVDIDAAPDQVWRVLADTAAYPEWNPFIVRSTGPLVEGGVIENVMRDAGGKERTFRPTLLVVRPGRELRWLGRLWLPRVFDGEHAFVLTELAPGRTRLEQFEHFRGILVPLLAGTLRKSTLPQFEAMNAALAARAAMRSAG